MNKLNNEVTFEWRCHIDSLDHTRGCFLKINGGPSHEYICKASLPTQLLSFWAKPRLTPRKNFNRAGVASLIAFSSYSAICRFCSNSLLRLCGISARSSHFDMHVAEKKERERERENRFDITTANIITITSLPVICKRHRSRVNIGWFYRGPYHKLISWSADIIIIVVINASQ